MAIDSSMTGANLLRGNSDMKVVPTLSAVETDEVSDFRYRVTLGFTQNSLTPHTHREIFSLVNKSENAPTPNYFKVTLRSASS